MNDKELKEYIRKIEPNFNTHLEKDTIEMNLEYYNMLEERMVRLINKTNNLQSKIDKAIELYENTTINCDGVAEDLLDKIIFDILKEDK